MRLRASGVAPSDRSRQVHDIEMHCRARGVYRRQRRRLAGLPAPPQSRPAPAFPGSLDVLLPFTEHRHAASAQGAGSRQAELQRVDPGTPGGKPPRSGAQSWLRPTERRTPCPACNNTLIAASAWRARGLVVWAALSTAATLCSTFKADLSVSGEVPAKHKGPFRCHSPRRSIARDELPMPSLRWHLCPTWCGSAP